MTLPRSLKWIAGALLAPIMLVALFIAVFGWNLLRAPVERIALEKTGRVLAIGGDIEVEFGWPLPRIHAGATTFANPAWAREKQMVAADAVEVVIDLPQLLRGGIVIPELRLKRPLIFLEQGADGRKNWLLDRKQQDEKARIHVGRLVLDQGVLGYDDAGRNTHIRAELSTSDTRPAGKELTFTAHGQYKGQPLTARGTGGPVLGLRDTTLPYRLSTDFSLGNTSVKADGSITNLLKPAAMDLRVALRGESLAQLYPLLGITFPESRAFVSEGRVVRGKQLWRYEKFTGRIGDSDIAGTFQIDSAGKRRVMKGELVSNLLYFSDLRTLMGARVGNPQDARLAQRAVAPTTPTHARLLPDIPLKNERWHRGDAEVTLRAKTFRRAKGLPLENLVTHLSLRDAELTFDPLDFGLAGGHIKGVIKLDGRGNPILTHAQVRASKLQLAKLFPSVKLPKHSIGQIDGEFDLAGSGNSVARMLASSSGKVGLVVARGEISQLMMEKIGLHLWETLQLNVTGDKLVKLHCGVADFAVKDGVMHANALIFDTEVTTLIGTGNIDLGQEKLDVTLNQKTKNTSLFSMRSPIHIRGSFARPEVEVDKARLTARTLGAIALGMVNPVLALIPLVDTGTGKDSDCAQLVRDARALP
ncbi:MAG: hypothetical protein B7Y41_00240 [Hydrogenophilales bacterium 28-61-23]|nr:MAG: hypothetical protein B7Y41_00240 [Hydrogenophilales bacterium 28-61-23]